MIVRFFKTGQSRGEAPVNYLLRMDDHQGELRAELPEVLEGSPRLTIDLINSITRQHKYASGCLAFKAGEQPSKADLHRIIDKFKAVVAPGLDAEQFNGLFVLHREPPDRKTGLSGCHIHFVLPMTLLAGVTVKGKSLAGRRWNPHPPGKQTIEVMELFTKVTNHEQGWAQVSAKPLRVNVDSFWRKAGKTSNSNKAELLQKELTQGIRSGQFTSREDLCSFLDESLGLLITRVGTDYVSVKFPGATKAVRLRGPMFDSQTDYATLRDAKLPNPGTEMLSVPQYEQAKERLSELLSERASYLSGNRHASQKRTTTKERKNGANEKRFRPTNGRGSQPSGRNELPITANRLERNLFQTGGGQRGNANDRDTAKSACGPQEVADTSKHFGHSAGGTSRGQRRQLGRVPAPTYGSTVDAQIWELAVQLNDCDPSQMAGITAQINFLMGVRSRQEGPRRSFKPRR